MGKLSKTNLLYVLTFLLNSYRLSLAPGLPWSTPGVCGLQHFMYWLRMVITTLIVWTFNWPPPTNPSCSRLFEDCPPSRATSTEDRQEVLLLPGALLPSILP